jgi:c-di-GMP-related signal transduction protein
MNFFTINQSADREKSKVLSYLDSLDFVFKYNNSYSKRRKFKQLKMIKKMKFLFVPINKSVNYSEMLKVFGEYFICLVLPRPNRCRIISIHTYLFSPLNLFTIWSISLLAWQPNFSVLKVVKFILQSVK